MRLQLALNVSDLDTAVDFYSKMFDTEPAKRKPGYANFAIEQPPLKLVLFEGTTAPSGSINHLGVEVETAEQVVAAESRLTETGLVTTGVDETICCFAEKTETWLEAPDGNRWEWYVKKADADQFENTIVEKVSAGAGVSPCGETGCC
ncbi:MAG: VOC family protein [Acidimicrobiia bacterium]|nr:VOC family protein [Acidimicrobiia bacterium]